MTVDSKYIAPDPSSQVNSVLDWYTLEPHEFIQAIFGEMQSGFAEVCYLAPEDAKLYPHTVVQWAELPIGELNPDLPNIMEMNAKGYNCYFAPAARIRKYEPETRLSKSNREYLFYPRGKAYDASLITALWVDVDVPGEAGYMQLISNIHPPSITVSSGGGWHGYWLLTEPLVIDDFNRDSIKRTLKGMAIRCGGDTKVAELARIMRLPGTINTKPGRGQQCYVYDYIPCRYAFAELELQHAPLAAPAQPQITRSVPIVASAGMPRWVENYLNSGAVQGERNNTAYAAARALLDNGFGTAETERLITNRAMSDGLTDQEITTLLHSAENAPRSTPEIPAHLRQRMAMGDHGGAK